MKFSRLAQLITVLMLCGSSIAAHGDKALVAVASNFTLPMQELADQFSEHSGHELQLAFGSSGRLYAQIINGAPFQVFLSADQEKPAQLERQGRVVPGSRFTYAVGQLVLWSNRPDLVISGPEVLDNDRLRLALANPRLAPYGRAAEQVLENLGQADSTRGRWVQGENIAQSFQFVRSGNADLGFVALSQIPAEQGLDNSWQVDSSLHEPIRQDAVLLQSGQECRACRDLMAYLQSDAARRIIRNYGYGNN